MITFFRYRSLTALFFHLMPRPGHTSLHRHTVSVHLHHSRSGSQSCLILYRSSFTSRRTTIMPNCYHELSYTKGMWSRCTFYLVVEKETVKKDGVQGCGDGVLT
ncbi:hypothetical protein BKA83DRAFT_4242578 [Pisolithus microcarpus]|nr:hypothetical protein BKA83DRAFT_4242578 [Pisolithus microcarpus]